MDWKHNTPVRSKWIFVNIWQSNFIALKYMFLELLPQPSNTLHVDELYFDCHKTIRNRYIEPLIKLQSLIKYDLLRFQNPRSCSNPDFNLSKVRKVGNLIDLDIYFAPRISICTVEYYASLRFNLCMVLNLLLNRFKNYRLELWMPLLTREYDRRSQIHDVVVIIVSQHKHINLPQVSLLTAADVISL